MKCSHCGSPHRHMHREGCPRLNLANWPELRQVPECDSLRPCVQPCRWCPEKVVQTYSDIK